jgi:hypothetical protein
LVVVVRFGRRETYDEIISFRRVEGKGKGKIDFFFESLEKR